MKERIGVEVRMLEEIEEKIERRMEGNRIVKIRGNREIKRVELVMIVEDGWNEINGLNKMWIWKEEMIEKVGDVMRGNEKSREVLNKEEIVDVRKIGEEEKMIDKEKEIEENELWIVVDLVMDIVRSKVRKKRKRKRKDIVKIGEGKDFKILMKGG